MPIYEYRCLGCGKEFELLTPTMNDPDDLVCAQCGSKDVERQLSVFAARQAEVERTTCGGCSSASADGPCCPWRAHPDDCCS